MKLSFRGSMVALVTPFSNGDVDEAALQRLVDIQIESGTSALVPCGTTGESATLSNEEHHKVIETTIQASHGRIPVIAGTGSNNTREAIALTKRAQKAGADAALLIAPYYNKPTQRGLYLHYKAIAEEVDLPLVVYNIASRTGVNITPDTFAQLAQLDNIVAVKEASGDLEQMSRILQITKGKIALISGDDALTLPILAIGGTGVISVAANIIPEDIAALITTFESGDLQESLGWHAKILPLVKAMFVETNPIPVKTAMGLMGLINPELRLPMCELSESNAAKLKDALEQYGLISSNKSSRKLSRSHRRTAKTKLEKV